MNFVRLGDKRINLDNIISYSPSDKNTYDVYFCCARGDGYYIECGSYEKLVTAIAKLDRATGVRNE